MNQSSPPEASVVESNQQEGRTSAASRMASLFVDYRSRKDLRGTWPQAIISLLASVLFTLFLRWAFFEPYVIPSGSMIPTLLVHDHILVNKFAYGIRVPFRSSWLLKFALPERGDVVVFRSLEDDGTFIVKRVVGLPGDRIEIAPSGQTIVNGQPIYRRALGAGEMELLAASWSPELRSEYLDRYEFYLEVLGRHQFISLSNSSEGERSFGPYSVGQDEIFLMGDNRDNSSDSRVWGPLPFAKVLGRASSIWLSCEETLPDSNQICDPSHMRWERMAKGID